MNKEKRLAELLADVCVSSAVIEALSTFIDYGEIKKPQQEHPKMSNEENGTPFGINELLPTFDDEITKPLPPPEVTPAFTGFATKAGVAVKATKVNIADTRRIPINPESADIGKWGQLFLVLSTETGEVVGNLLHSYTKAREYAQKLNEQTIIVQAFDLYTPVEEIITHDHVSL